jgi:hypothetical protein
MWANSFWGLLGLAATFGLAMLLLTPEQEWLRERQSILFAEARVVLVHHVDKIEVVFAKATAAPRCSRNFGYWPLSIPLAPFFEFQGGPFCAGSVDPSLS